MREEDDAGDEVGVCGGEGEGDWSCRGTKPPSRRRGWEGVERLPGGGILVRGVEDADDALALVEPG